MPNPSPSLKGRDVWRRSHVGIAVIRRHGRDNKNAALNYAALNAIPYNTKRAPKRSFRMNICR